MHIAVAGGGIIGLSTALVLLDRGHEVTVFDPQPASPDAASYHAGGMLAPAAEVVYQQDLLIPLMHKAGELYPQLVDLVSRYTDLPTGYRTDGTLVVAHDRADTTHLSELRDYQTRAGLDVERLTPRAARKLEPALAPGLSGAVSISGDHQIQPRLFLAALLRATDTAGGSIRREKVAHIDGATGTIRTESGSYAADQVVLAAGLGAGDIDGWFDGDDNPLDLRPVLGEVIQLRVPDHQYPLLNRVVRGFVEDRPIYLIPRRDRTLTIGATTREDGRHTPQAGDVLQLLRDASLVCPAVEECDFVETSVGARPGSPDDLPYLGRVGDHVVVSTGYFRHGILLAGLAAQAGADLTEGREPDIDLSACTPLRHRRKPA